MKVKFVVVSALVGAMSSFGLNPALSAPSTEPTNLAALLKARQQNKSAAAEKPTTAPKKASVVSRRAAPATKGSTGKRSQSKDTTTARNAKGGAYSTIINRYASTYGVPSALAHAVVRHESNFQQFGMKYLAMAQKLGGGSTCGTILKYNAGHGATRMNPTSAKYCSSVKAYMRAL